VALRDQIIRIAIAVLLAVNGYFAAVEPCTSAEGAVYERFASHTILDMWKSPLDPRLGLTYGLLARIVTRMGGVSELTIRVPAILGGLLFWIALSEFCRKLKGWPAVLIFLVVAANPWTWRAFSTATGAALAVGLLAAAARLAPKNRNAASLLMGLAIGSDAVLAIPAMAAGGIAAAILGTNAWTWVDELILPGLVGGLFLLLPALLIREKPAAAATDDHGTRQLIKLLMRQPHESGKVRVGASSLTEPGLFFYRRRYHLDWIQIVSFEEEGAFFLLSSSEQALMAKRGLRTLESAPGSILAVP
jgi:hypothetical protein